MAAAIKKFIIEGPFPRTWKDEDWEKEGYVGGKIKTIKLFSIARPHMRAFVSLVPLHARFFGNASRHTR